MSLLAAASASELAVKSTFGMKSPDVKLCSPCFNIGEQGINQLLNYILNAGVIGGCQALCAGALPAGGLPAVGCELVCGAVGFKAFVAAINHVDLDPIYLCEFLKACPAAPDDAYLELVEVAAAPDPVTKGQTVKMAIQMNVTNATGVGEFHLNIDGPGSACPIGQGFFLETGIPAGLQMLEVSLPVKDSQDSQGMPATFDAGKYNFSFHICQGECGSKHPHSKDFGAMMGYFHVNATAPPSPSPSPSPTPSGPSTTPAPSCEDQMDPDSCQQTSDPMGESCQWCDTWFMCQDSMMPCDQVSV